MKKVLLGFMLCTMVLCITNVSYGSDIAPTAKTEFSMDNTIVSDLSVSNFDIDVVIFSVEKEASTMDVNSFDTHDAVGLTAGSLDINIEKFIPIATSRGSTYIDNDYNTYLDVLEKPSAKAVLDSNHVGKLGSLNKAIVTFVMFLSERKEVKLE